MTNRTLRTLDAGSAIQSGDIFLTRQGTDTVDKRVTIDQITTYVAASFVPYTGATTDVDLGNFSLNAKSMSVAGTAGNGHIHLKHQSADATSTGSSTALFADSSGDIKWKNDGAFYTTIKTSLNTDDRVYTFPDAAGTLALTSDLSSYAPLNSPTFTGTVTLPAGQVVNGVTLSTAQGTSTFLRGDGTYAAPSSGGSPGGSSGQIQFNNAGSFGGLTNATADNGNINLAVQSSPTAPSAGISLFSRDIAGKVFPAFIGADNAPSEIQDHIGFNNVRVAIAGGGANAPAVLGLPAISGTGTATTAAAVTTGTAQQKRNRVDYRVTTASTTAIAAARTAANVVWNEAGYLFICNWGPATGVATATNRGFAGLRVSATPTDVEPSSLTNIIGMGWDAADTNIQIMHNDGSGTATKINLGASFPVPTSDVTDFYRLVLYAIPNGDVKYEVKNYTNGAVATGTISTDKPAQTQALGPIASLSVGGTSSVIGVAFGEFYIKTLTV